MAESKQQLNVLVTGGAESVGLAAVRALLRAGHKVVATAGDAESALAIRLAGALPVYPDLGRASEVLSALQWARADAVVHAGPQVYGGLPHASSEYAAHADQLVNMTGAVVEAAKAHGVKRVVSLSFAYLYDSGRGAAKEGDHDVPDNDYSPMLLAESLVSDSGLNGYIIRSGYIYGGNCADLATVAELIKRSRRLPSGTKPASWIHEDDLAAAIVTLLEAEDEAGGVELVNAADDLPRSPNEFVTATCAALGLNAAAFATDGILSVLRQKTFRDILLEREIVIDSSTLKERFGWRPKHGSIVSGLDATALVWRMKDAVSTDDYYNNYTDEAAIAIAARVSGEGLPQPIAVADEPAPKAEAAAEPAAPAKAAAPPPSDGPTPWNEDEAKREERRRKAMERKAKRAAKQAGG